MFAVNSIKVNSLVIANNKSGGFAVLVDKKGVRELSRDEFEQSSQQIDLQNSRACFIDNSGQVLISIPTIGNKFLPGYYDNQFKLIDLDGEKIKELSRSEAQKLSCSEDWREYITLEIPRKLVSPVLALIKNSQEIKGNIR